MKLSTIHNKPSHNHNIIHSTNFHDKSSRLPLPSIFSKPPSLNFLPPSFPLESIVNLIQTLLLELYLKILFNNS